MTNRRRQPEATVLPVHFEDRSGAEVETGRALPGRPVPAMAGMVTVPKSSSFGDAQNARNGVGQQGAVR